jgi:hypothetical protein
MQITRSKIAALVIALGYLAIVIAASGWDIEGVGIICLLLPLPMAFIWFPDEIAGFLNTFGKGGYTRFNSETPAFMFTLVGWLFLVGYLPLLACLLGHK